MTDTAQTIPQTTSTTPNTSIVLAAVRQMPLDDLKLVFKQIRLQMKVAHLVTADNLNVVSVRLPISTCDDVRKLAYHRQATISDVVRDAIDDYCKREKKR